MIRALTLLALIAGSLIPIDKLRYPRVTVLICWLINITTILLWL